MTRERINEMMKNTVEKMADREMSSATKEYLVNSADEMAGRCSHGSSYANANGHLIDMYLDK